MPTYLYGLILTRNSDRVPLTVQGIGRGAVRVARCDGLSAVVSTIAERPSRHDSAAVAAHDLTLTRVVRHAVTVLSSRFGQTFPDDDALCRELAASQDRERMLATLERLDGYGEMRIVMRDAAEPPGTLRASIEAPENPGRAYLESLRQRVAPRPPLDFRALAGNWIRDERVERRGGIQVIAHLVRFEDEPRYRVELVTHPALEGISVMGPHALYSFAEPAA